MTLPAIFLIDKLGRRTLLLSSLATMSISSIVLGYSINNEMYVVASVGIMAFVVSFATGLGPVPFVLLGELPKEEVSSTILLLEIFAGSHSVTVESHSCVVRYIMRTGEISYSFNSSRKPSFCFLSSPFSLALFLYSLETVLTLLLTLQGTNWISNLLIGVFFLPLRNLLASLTSSSSSSSPTSSGSGTVFYVFAVVSAIGCIVVGRLLR